LSGERWVVSDPGSLMRYLPFFSGDLGQAVVGFSCNGG